jgi:predicted transcriptional regulator
MALHPNAYLKNTRNVKSGVSARSKVLTVLDKNWFSAPLIAKETGLSYGVVTYHLKLLESEATVKRKGSGRYVWLSTGFGQKRLI